MDFQVFPSFNHHVCLGGNRKLTDTALLSTVFLEHMPVRRYRGKFNFLLSLLYTTVDFIDGLLKCKLLTLSLEHTLLEDSIKDIPRFKPCPHNSLAVL